MVAQNPAQEASANAKSMAQAAALTGMDKNQGLKSPAIPFYTPIKSMFPVVNPLGQTEAALRGK